MLLNIWNNIMDNAVNIIAALSAIGTFITAFIAYRAIKETQHQRESSYRPDLYLEATDAHLLSPEFGQYFCSVRFMQEIRTAPSDGYKIIRQNDIEYDTERFLPPQRWMVAHFFNIGLGTAKAVDYKWNFDLEKSIALLKKYAGNSPMIISKNVGEYSNLDILYTISDVQRNYTQYLHASEINKTGSTDFIRANNIPVIQSQLIISGPYLQILLAYLFYKYKLVYEETKDFIHETFDELPPLYLHVSYKDVQNKLYSKKINVAFTFYSTVTTSQPRPKLLIVKNLDFGNLFTRVSEVAD